MRTSKPQRDPKPSAAKASLGFCNEYSFSKKLLPEDRPRPHTLLRMRHEIFPFLNCPTLPD